jgi:hypothetical protein
MDDSITEYMEETYRGLDKYLYQKRDINYTPYVRIFDKTHIKAL